VVTRRSIHRWWYLHSLRVATYGTAEFPRLAAMLTQRPAAVLIRSYRTDWLPKQDRDFIRAHYVPLADDFWVLGAAITGDRTWDCLYAGRYALEVVGDGSSPAPVVFANGQPLTAGVHRLERARYDLRISGSGRAALMWLGPRLARPLLLPPYDHARLFVNWY
jgi:hypothetical protein